MGTKRNGGVCWLISPIDVTKEENDELKQANYQSRAWHESQKTSMTEASPKADNLQEHTCPFQDLL